MDVFSPLNCAEFEQLAALWVEVNLRVPCDKSSSLLDYNNWELKETGCEKPQRYLSLEFSFPEAPTPGDVQVSHSSDVSDEIMHDSDLSSYEDPSCDTDTVTLRPPPLTVSSHFNGWIHVLLHPVYQVPCPFLQLRRGEDEAVLDSTLVAHLLHDQLKAAHAEGRGQGLPHLQPQLVEEEHPLLGVPAVCLHICGLGERLELLQLAESQTPHQQSDPLAEFNARRLYLLQWFSLVGPHLALAPLSARAYNQMSSLLLSEEGLLHQRNA